MNDARIARIKAGARLAAVWIPTLFLVFVFAPQAWNKLSDTGGWAVAFRHWGYPTWFRILVGFVETGAALLLLWPRSAVVGAALIIAVMLGGTATHIVKDDPVSAHGRKARLHDVTDSNLTRRGFLADSGRLVTAGWLARNIPWLTALAGCARDDAHNGDALVALTPAEAKTMRAFAARIIPSDDSMPGADEAGAVFFIDRAFRTPFFAESVPLIRAGLATLDARARDAGADSFATLPRPHQETIMREVEREPFFAAARTLVIIGTFADPSYGGNRHGAGWTIVGLEHRPSYSAPYGWYDAHADIDSSKRAA